MKALLFAALLVPALACFGAEAADLGISQTAIAPSVWSGATIGFTLRPVNAGTDGFGDVGPVRPTKGAAAPVAAPAPAILIAPNSAAPATAIVTETLPAAGFTQLSASGTGWACSVAGTQITCQFGHAMAGGQAFPPITVGATANNAGTYQSCASISFVPVPGTAADTVAGNNNGCTAVTVKAVAPQQACIAVNGVPQLVTGNGHGSSQAAQLAAQNDWSNKALPYGSDHANWNHAAHKSMMCTNSLSGFQTVTNCSYTGQPCL